MFMKNKRDHIIASNYYCSDAALIPTKVFETELDTMRAEYLGTLI